MADAERILVVDDDRVVREMLAEYLDSHGYQVDCADSGAAMRAAIEREPPDLVLLDLRLPDQDGLTLARYLREHYDIGIIMVTGSSETVDRVIGLEIGADDYIGKPFDLRELRARIKSVLRRLQSAPPDALAGSLPASAFATGGAANAPAHHRRLRLAHCTLDIGSHQLFDGNGREIPITTMEFDLLHVFATHPNQVLSRDQLLTMTRNREWEPFDRSIDIRIARLRRKIEPDSSRPQAIRTVRGIGYMYVPPTA
ncbi:MAG TPA: response regulator [Burkholderiaceae bacterium]|nr:response regulator [Burkholderiaceae bacterium]